MTNKIKYLPVVFAVGFAASLALFGLSASAATTPTPGQGGGWGGPGGHPPAMHSGMIGSGIFGTVSAINGTSLTVTANTRMRPNATTTPATAMTYTVDASNATVYKNGATSTISSVATGDMIFAQGTVSGSNVTATVIQDGMGARVPGAMGKGGFGHGSSSTQPMSPIQGNGEPVVAGSITAVSGTTLTVTNASNVTYTIDASNAKLVKNGTTTTITDLSTGDNVIVQGMVNGTSITASSVIDQGVNKGSNGSSTAPRGGGSGFGFFGAIGSFFKHIFGF